VHLPLAWMLGPMTFNLVASLMRLPVAVPAPLRNFIIPVIGVYLGSAFSPENLGHMQRWPWSLAAVMLFTILLTMLTYQYYRKVAGFDPVTALFSATPGGLSMMVIYGAVAGGDERRIALTQTLRVVTVVFLVPPLVTGWAAAPAGGPPLVHEFSWLQVLMLITGAAAGVLIGRLIRLPAAPMTGAMLASATLYGSGLVALELPRLLLLMALLILGSTVGCRFAGTRLSELLAIGRYAVVSVAFIMILAVLAAILINLLLHIDFLAALLAFAPGGVTEMCLIAVALDIDPTFVAVHQLARVIFIISLAPLLGKMAAAGQRRQQ
jgi:membrane AbrB-like protein